MGVICPFKKMRRRRLSIFCGIDLVILFKILYNDMKIKLMNSARVPHNPSSHPSDRIPSMGNYPELGQTTRARLSLAVDNSEKARRWQEVHDLLGVYDETRDSAHPRELFRMTFLQELKRIDALNTLEEKTQALVDLMERYSPDTQKHLVHVDQLARSIAAFFPELKMDQIALAMKLHDIGKIGIPLHVLEFDGKYGEEERKIMRLHPELSGSILKAMGYPENITNIASFHHIRQLTNEVMDENNQIITQREFAPFSYPNTLFVESGLPELSEDIVVSFLIDEYEALTSSFRGFRTEYSKDKAFEILHYKYDTTDYAFVLKRFEAAVRSLPDRIGGEE
jgi:hypothetical protein